MTEAFLKQLIEDEYSKSKSLQSIYKAKIKTIKFEDIVKVLENLLNTEFEKSKVLLAYLDKIDHNNPQDIFNELISKGFYVVKEYKKN